MKDSLAVLVVDDHIVSRKILQKSLEKAGHPVAVAENGKRALERLKDSFYPIIITDWMMPVMDGLELCRAVRRAEFSNYIYIIFITAKDSKEDIIKGLEAGADEYLTKPFNEAELIARLKTARRIIELERSLKEQNEKVRMLSITDPLTGAYNRLYMADSLPKEIRRSCRYHHPLSVILCDIDHFKRINDCHGHRAGDRLLQGFVECLRNSVRKDIDWIVRFGGEEFLIVMPETNLDGGRRAAERLRRRVAENPIHLGYQGPVRITASFGVAALIPSGSSEGVAAELLIETADRSLYRAKNRGRNTVEAEGIIAQRALSGSCPA